MKLMPHVISIANQKGGVGKTTTTLNLGMALRAIGHSVLLVDNDSQCNLTSYATHLDDFDLTVDDLYTTRRKPLNLSELVTVSDGVSLLPADEGLIGAEHYLVQRPDKEYVLKNALRGAVEAFDFILIDNPPALNLVTVNGLVASHSVLIPVQLEFFSLQGVVFLQRTIESLKEKNPQLKLLGILPNMFNNRRKLNWEVLSALKKEFKEYLFETKIHDSVKLAESSGHGASVMDYAPSSRSSKEFLCLAEEVARHVDSWT